MEALKITGKVIRENAFEHEKKKPRLSANRPSNNWALVQLGFIDSFTIFVRLNATALIKFLAYLMRRLFKVENQT